MHLLLLLFSYPHLYSKITKGSVYVKMDRSEEKQQALEKLLSSDVYPPIHYTVEEQTTFFGGGDQKVSSINYSISMSAITGKWSESSLSLQTLVSRSFTPFPFLL